MKAYFSLKDWGKVNGDDICNGLTREEYLELSEEKRMDYVEVEIPTDEDGDFEDCSDCFYASICPAQLKDCEQDEDECSNCSSKLECPVCCGDCDTCEVCEECPDCMGECNSCSIKNICIKNGKFSGDVFGVFLESMLKKDEKVN